MDIVAARKKAAEWAKKKAAEARQAGSDSSAPHRAEEAAVVPEIAEEQSTVEPAVEFSPLDQAEPSVAVERLPQEPAPLGEETAVEPGAPEEVEILAFKLGNEAYGVLVDRVREVLRMREITPVPHTAEYMLGVTSLRGKVLPVIDLGKRLGLTSGIRDERSRIVVVSAEGEEAGMLVDRMSGVVRIPAEAVRPAPETIEQGEGAEFLSGIARKGDELFILLDVEKAVGI